MWLESIRSVIIQEHQVSHKGALIPITEHVRYRLSSFQYWKTALPAIVCVPLLPVPPYVLVFLEQAQCCLSSSLLLILVLPSRRTSPSWLVWLSWLAIVLQNERLWVQFLISTQACVVGPDPGWGRARGSWLMFLSHADLPLPLFLPPFPSL